MADIDKETLRQLVFEWEPKEWAVRQGVNIPKKPNGFGNFQGFTLTSSAHRGVEINLVMSRVGGSRFRAQYNGNVKLRDGKVFNASFWMNKDVATPDMPGESEIVELLAKAAKLLPE